MECPSCLSGLVVDGTCFECGMDVSQLWLRSDGLLGAGPEEEVGESEEND